MKASLYWRAIVLIVVSSNTYSGVPYFSASSTVSQPPISIWLFSFIFAVTGFKDWLAVFIYIKISLVY